MFAHHRERARFTIERSLNPRTPRQTLLLIMIPLLATFIGLRLYLHVVGVEHIYPGGLLVHHLFTGNLLVIPAAFVLAFGTRHWLKAILAPVALGIGSALVLDEIVYLVATDATDADYVSPRSLWGAIIFITLALVLLLALYRIHCCQKPATTTTAA